MKFWPLDRQKFKSRKFLKFSKKKKKKNPKKSPIISKKLPIFLGIIGNFSTIFFRSPRLLHALLHSQFYHRFIGSKPIYRRYFDDFPDIFPIFLPFDNRCSKLFRGRLISNISTKYRQ